MTSKREDILAAVATILDGTAGATVYRSRAEAIRREESPALVVEFVSDTPDYDNLSIMNWALTFRVSIVVRGAVPDQLADPIAVSAYNLLMADRTLGGKVMDLLPGEQRFDIIEGDKTVGVLQGLWIAKHRTAQNALDA